MIARAVPRRARAAALAGACWALAAAAQSGVDAAFELLDTQALPTYKIGREADLAAYGGWSDLEAATARRAPVTRGSFAGAAGATIHYRLYRHRAETRGGVVIASGRTEGLVMYQELIRDLVANGYSVYIHDHRGQGFSQRLLTSDTTIGYVDDFDRYVEDLAAFVAGPVRAARIGNRRPLFLLAHSMGGAVSALYLEQQAGDSGFAAAALVTPMMEPWAAGAADAGLAARLADTYCERYSIDTTRAGPLAEKYAEGGPFDEQYAAVRAAPPGTPNDLTHSALRFARHWQARAEARCDGADCGSPHAKVGGVSVRWFNQACVGSEKARGMAAAKIALPVLLLQGERDIVVKPTAQADFCRRLNEGGHGYCVGRTVPGALHSIFIEADAWRVPALRSVLGFFDCVRKGSARCG